MTTMTGKEFVRAIELVRDLPPTKAPEFLHADPDDMKKWEKHGPPPLVADYLAALIGARIGFKNARYRIREGMREIALHHLHGAHDE